MIELKNRKVNDTGKVLFTTEGLIDLLYRGIDISQVDYWKDDLLVEYNIQCENRNKSEWLCIPKQNIELSKIEWFIPQEYKELDIIEYLLDKCSSDIEKTRVIEELEIYAERNLGDLLKFLVYLVDVFRKEKIVWGVGRGSSVSSFCLFLIGIHKINSIEYGLDIHEFLR